MATHDDTGVRLLRRPEVQRRTGLSRSTLYALEAAGRFPRRVKLSERCAAWPSDAVDTWIAERIATRYAKAVAA